MSPSDELALLLVGCCAVPGRSFLEDAGAELVRPFVELVRAGLSLPRSALEMPLSLPRSELGLPSSRATTGGELGPSSPR